MTERHDSGRYARLEGMDGSGKSTQIKLARAYAQQEGIRTLFVREPGNPDFGEKMRDILLHDPTKLDPETEYLLLTADRSHLARRIIAPALEQGYTVIGDRGFESSFAYQGAGGGVNKEALQTIADLSLPERYRHPDALAVLALSEQAYRIRRDKRNAERGPDKIEGRDEAYFERVRQAYQGIGELDYATVVNADQTPEEVFDELRPILFGPEHA